MRQLSKIKELKVFNEHFYDLTQNLRKTKQDQYLINRVKNKDRIDLPKKNKIQIFPKKAVREMSD